MTNLNNNSLSCCPLGAPELCASTKKPDANQEALESDRKSGSWADNGDPECGFKFKSLDGKLDAFNPALKVYSSYAEIRKERKDPFKQKQEMKILNTSSQMRVVNKVGKISTFRHQKKELSMVVKDLFISSIHLSWPMTFFNFFGSFFLSWFFFAVVWYLIGLWHGDFDPEISSHPEHQVCVANMVDFTSAFLFSVETQHTIGYGVRATTGECPIAIIVMSVQSIIGVFLTACMTGIVFAKFTKPTHRAKTIVFSENALITMRNGAFYLLCRVADLRPTHLIESHISGYVVRNETTQEGEEIPHHLFAIEFGTDLDGTQDFFQLFWPIVLSHRIDEASPLWEVSPMDLITEKFEIILTLEGTTPETGNNIQVRTSYLPSEILWGYKFEHSCVKFNEDIGKYEVSFDTLNTIIKDNTPCMSPSAYEDKKKAATSGAPATSTPANSSPAISKTFFSKPRHKNKVHKLPGQTE